MRTSARNTSLNSTSPAMLTSSAHLDAGAAHVDAEVGDAPVLGLVGIGAGEQHAEFGLVRRGWSRPFAR